MGKLISTLLFQPPEVPTPLDLRKYFWLTTSIGHKIPAFFIQQPQARFTILFSHGNAEDLGMIHSNLSELSRLLYVNILAYDYSGYGYGTRKRCNVEKDVEPTEENCYRDIEAAFDYLTKVELISPHRIILYGRSVGSGPSCYLAQKITKDVACVNIAGMVLHSPFLSVCRVVVDAGIDNPLDIFPNVSRMKDISCPVYIMHGTKDAIVPFYHGETLFQAIPAKFQYPPFWAQGMGHNNIENDMCPQYVKRLQKFFLYLIRVHKLPVKKRVSNPAQIVMQTELKPENSSTNIPYSIKHSSDPRSGSAPDGREDLVHMTFLNPQVGVHKTSSRRSEFAHQYEERLPMNPHGAYRLSGQDNREVECAMTFSTFDDPV